MHYRGAFHLCLKKRKKKWGAKQKQGVEVFSYNAGCLSLHNRQTCSVCSSPPSTVLLPFTGGGSTEVAKLVCLCSEEE